MSPERIAELRITAELYVNQYRAVLDECLDEIERRHTSEEMIEQCELAAVRANKRAAEMVRKSCGFFTTQAKDQLADEIEKKTT